MDPRLQAMLESILSGSPLAAPTGTSQSSSGFGNADSFQPGDDGSMSTDPCTR